jgi:hypothetical protein
MFDIELHLRNQPGELARMGQALGQAGVSVEGGGMFLFGGVGIAHFLVQDDRNALAEAGVSIEVLYSDHDGQLVLLVDDVSAARRVRDAWNAASTKARST